MIKELIVKEDPKSPISEVFRTLRTNIQFMNNRNKLKSILVTSTLPAEGKSWISANLAATFAQAGKKVILLDADMRKGRQYSIFKISPVPGLSNYLSGFSDDEKKVDLADYLQETEVENLFVIPSGNIPPNPSELLVSENMLELLQKLKEICDIVILDGPPTQLVTDSLIITRIVDSTVIVSASNETKKDNLHRIINNIQKVGGKIAGIVLNKIPISSKEYIQTYYYGSNTFNKVSNNKKRPATPRNLNYNETRYRNTQRARELVNQNKVNELINIEKQDNTEILELKEEVERNVVQNDSGINITENDGLEKTNDILKQINEYLENEKKNLK